MQPLYSGGKLQRLIEYSLFKYVEGLLDTLGWFADTGNFQPFTFTDVAVDPEDGVQENTISISYGSEDVETLELGSNAITLSRFVYLDVYPEDSSIQSHVVGDLRDALLGRLEGLGIDKTCFPVRDWSVSASTQVMDDISISRIEVGSERNYGKPYLKHWKTISFKIEYEL